MHFLFEAVLVGLFLLPIFYVAELAGLSKWVTVFLAGALFHLTAELTGINRSYVLTKC
jgi:hypothetical protein